MTMLCGNTIAEINRDTETTESELFQYQAEQELWRMCYEQLLAGRTVEVRCKSVCLAERMADQYQHFADMVDNDVDFMSDFLAGHYSEKLNNLFKQEAKTLAAILVGEI